MTFDAQEAVRQGAQAQGASGEIHDVRQATCCIAGCGPAGAMLGLLLARKGVDVLVLEKHGDFLRDFRGDTIHPSTMEIMDELGLADRLLLLPHTKASQLRFRTPQGAATLADFGRIKGQDRDGGEVVGGAERAAQVLVGEVDQRAPGGIAPRLELW